MKVALIVPGGVDRGGEERVIPCLLWAIERLARTHELHVFAVRQEPEPADYRLLGAHIHNIGRAPAAFRLFTALVDEHRRGAFDVLHAVWAWPGMVAGIAGRALRVPVLTHLTGGDLSDLPGIDYGLRRHWRGRAALAAAVRLATRLTVPSAAMLAAAHALGVDAERLTYGVALDRWPPRAPRPRAPNAPLRLVHVASLNRVKDQRTLIAAAAALRDAGVSFHLDVVGEDTLGGCIQRRVATLDLERHVTFHGFLPQRALRPVVDQADVLVHTSLHEADPIALLEAAVAGVPAVGTAVGHFVEWSPDAAVAVPVGDHAGLAREIATLAANDARRLDLAEAAQQRALALDADRTAAALDALYERLLATRAPYRRRTVIPVLGVGVAFESADRRLTAAVEDRYGVWRRRCPPAPAAVLVELRSSHSSDPRPEGPLHTSLTDRHRLDIRGRVSRAFADDDHGRALAIVGRALRNDATLLSRDVLHTLTSFLVAAQNRTPVHGAALRQGDAGLVLTGPSGVGKSTLAHAAWRAGVDVLADDAVYVETGSTPRIWGDPWGVRVRLVDGAPPPADGELTMVGSERRFVVRFASDAGAPPPFVRRAGVCFLARGTTTAIRHIPASEAVDELLRTVEPGFDRFRDALPAAARQLTDSGAWRLTLGGPPREAVPLLVSALHEVLAGI